MTGMRLAEITNLKWTQIDFGKMQIEIIQRDDFHTKTGKSRNVPMHTTVLEILKRRSLKQNIYVFGKSNGYKYTESFVSHYFRTYRMKVGLPKEFHFHSLRHTCASLLVNSGVSIYTVKEILGHASVLTTQIYSHMAPNVLLESINKI